MFLGRLQQVYPEFLQKGLPKNFILQKGLPKMFMVKFYL